MAASDRWSRRVADVEPSPVGGGEQAVVAGGDDVNPGCERNGEVDHVVAPSVDLMDAFAATGVVDDEVLDLLAQAFVQADEHVWWRCPDDWFDGELVIELGDDAAAGKSSAAEEPAGGGPTVVRRRVPPAVRRWAVRRLVAQQPSRWGPVLQLATAAPTKVAAPILLGLLDGEASLTAAAADLVREAAIASSDATVRMAGLRHLAASDRDAAVARAAARSRIGRCRTGWFDHALGLHPSEPSEHGGPGALGWVAGRL
ncbi:MAG: hypothetical protein AB7Q92_32590 [Acidimicrobiia bacterium]